MCNHEFKICKICCQKKGLDDFYSGYGIRKGIKKYYKYNFCKKCFNSKPRKPENKQKANERSRKYKKRCSNKLTDIYARKVASANTGKKRSEIDDKTISETKKRIIKKRIKRVIKSIDNEKQN